MQLSLQKSRCWRVCVNTGCVNLLECVIEMKRLIKIWKGKSWKVNPKVSVYYHSLSQTLSEHTDFINMSFLSEAWAHPGCVCVTARSAVCL